MRVKFIRLLVAAIALVVPLQGMTAVMAGQCMALGHHQAGGGHDSQDDAQHGHDGHDHPAHSHDATSSGDGDESGAHCGPCTACCASASIASPATVSIVSSPSAAPYVFSQLPPLGVQPDGLDRPPLAL